MCNRMLKYNNRRTVSSDVSYAVRGGVIRRAQTDMLPSNDWWRQREDLVCAICLFVVSICKCSINPFTSPNPVSSHLTHDNMMEDASSFTQSTSYQRKST
jgi:hypothetical protein